MDLNQRINGRHEQKLNRVHHFNATTDFIVSSKYSQLEFLEYGGFSIVCKATNTETNTKVAIKMIDLEECPRIFSVLREIRISKYLTINKCKAVVELKDIEIPANKNEQNKWEFNKVYLMYEYMYSDLQQIIKSKDIKLKKEDHKRLLAHILFGLRDMHHANILHRDIKPSNLLVDSKGAKYLKICDFGLARPMKTSHSNRVHWNVFDSYLSDEDEDKTVERQFITMEALEEVKSIDGKSLSYEVPSQMIKEKELNGLTNRLGTAGYRSPELTLGCEVYQKPSDIWAVGCVFAEILKKTRLFQVRRRGTNDDEFNTIISTLGSSFITGDLMFIDNKEGLKLAKKKIAEATIGRKFFKEFEKILDRNGIKLLKKLLSFDPNRRITAQNALKSPYLEDTYNELIKEFKHLELVENFEKEEEQHESEEGLKEKLWNEMEDFHGYNKRKVNDDPTNRNKVQRTL